MNRSEVSANVRRVHSFTGAVLAAFVVFHVWQFFRETSSEVPFAERASTGIAVVLTETLLVIVPLLVHAGLGAWIAITSPLHERYGDRGSSLLQRISGVVTLLFIGIHLTHTWLVKLTRGTESGGPYGMLWSDLGRPLYLGSYVIGLTAVCFHLGQGVSGFVLGFDRIESQRGVQLVRTLAFVLAFVLWAVSLNAVAYFATGAGLFLDAQPPSAQE